VNPYDQVSRKHVPVLGQEFGNLGISVFDGLTLTVEPEGYFQFDERHLSAGHMNRIWDSYAPITREPESTRLLER
jgi:hypothetical protein